MSRTPPGTGSEALRIRKAIGCFNEKEHPECQYIRDMFDNPSQPELRAIAEVLKAKGVDVPPPDRNAKRSHTLMYLWFYDNWEAIAPKLKLIHLLDENEEIIGGETRLRDV